MFQCKHVLWILAFTVVACSGVIQAEELTQLDDRFPIAHLREYLPELGRVVYLLGESRVEEATEKLGQQIYRGPRQFTEDNNEWRQSMRREFRVFETVARKFESVDYVGLKPISSKSCTIILIANGNGGPVLFRAHVFRHSDQWHIVGIDFHNNFQKITELIEPYLFNSPYTLDVDTLNRTPRFAEKAEVEKNTK